MLGSCFGAGADVVGGCWDGAGAPLDIGFGVAVFVVAHFDRLNVQNMGRRLKTRKYEYVGDVKYLSKQ